VLEGLAARAEAEAERLRALQREHLGDTADLQLWDLPYYTVRPPSLTVREARDPPSTR
jgi:Zn-dependent oligopeptidase